MDAYYLQQDIFILGIVLLKPLSLGLNGSVTINQLMQNLPG